MRKWFAIVLLGVYLGIGAAWVITGRGGWLTSLAMFAAGFLVGVLLQRTFDPRESDGTL